MTYYDSLKSPGIGLVEDALELSNGIRVSGIAPVELGSQI
jgi:hypothetical protein